MGIEACAPARLVQHEHWARLVSSVSKVVRVATIRDRHKLQNKNQQDIQQETPHIGEKDRAGMEIPQDGSDEEGLRGWAEMLLTCFARTPEAYWEVEKKHPQKKLATTTTTIEGDQDGTEDDGAAEEVDGNGDGDINNEDEDVARVASLQSRTAALAAAAAVYDNSTLALHLPHSLSDSEATYQLPASESWSPEKPVSSFSLKPLSAFTPFTLGSSFVSSAQQQWEQQWGWVAQQHSSTGPVPGDISAPELTSSLLHAHANTSSSSWKQRRDHHFFQPLACLGT